MKIVYFYQYFTTPRGAYSTRVYEFTRRWVAAGAEATVVTSLYDKSDVRAEKMFETQSFEGVTVKIVNVAVSNRQSFLRRIWSFAAYSGAAVWHALTLPADVVVCSSGPLFVGVPGLAAKWLRRRPFVFEVRDLWPEGAIQLGYLRNRALIRLARWFERLCYRQADRVVALSPDMARWVRETSQRDDVAVVPNASDNESFPTGPGAAAAEGEGARVLRAIYTGSLGSMNDPWQLIRLAEALRRREARFVIDVYGGGRELEPLRRRQSELGLDNIVFHGGRPKSEVFAALRRADCALLIFHPSMDAVSPNKLFDALAAGVPVAQATQGWIKSLLAENECGATAPKGDAEALADAVIAMTADPERHARMRLNARALAERSFDRARLANRFLEILRDAASKSGVRNL